MTDLLLATRNPGKRREFAALLAGSPVVLHSLEDHPEWPDVVEDGDSFLANARKKAQETARMAGLPCLADDSGLVVDALGGAPGVYSARYAGEPKSDAANNAKLLRDLSPYDAPEQRRARFVCVLVYATPQGVEAVFEGKVEGTIAKAPRGENGFGYDPLFLPLARPEFTTAELSSEEKHALSHRGQAARAFCAWYQTQLSRSE